MKLADKETRTADVDPVIARRCSAMLEARVGLGIRESYWQSFEERHVFSRGYPTLLSSWDMFGIMMMSITIDICLRF